MDKSVEITEEVLEKINQYAVKPLIPEQLYCFKVRLCDNDIDRDGEKFTIPALEELAELFKGTTGIFDHQPSALNQTARIYDTAVETDPERTTKDGEPYTSLMAWAYMVRTPENQSLIALIDGGIRKEVSVSCSVGKKSCSICGSNRIKKICAHVKGKTYGKRLCYALLDEPIDAYEWSFVAVPAQKNAGVAKESAQARQELMGELFRLSAFTETWSTVKSVREAAQDLDINGLRELKTRMLREVRAYTEDPAPASGGKAIDLSSYRCGNASLSEE